MEVSIIIVNWNTKDFLRNCLSSVYAESAGMSFEVIVVDNGSTDGSAGMVRRQFPEVKVIANRANRGFAAANNQGISLAQGRYVLLLNSDTIVLNQAIAKTVCFADGYPKAGVTGCRVLNPDRTVQNTCFLFPSVTNMLLSCSYLYKIFPRSRFFGRERMTWWARNDVRQVDVVTGCFMLVRRKAIEEIGLLDERFFMYGEETDWCYRFKKGGWETVFTPAGEIIHFGGQSSNKIKPEMLIELRLSILKFMKKHHSRLTYAAACLLTVLFFLVRLPVWLCIGIFSNSRRPAALARLRACVIGVHRILFAAGNFRRGGEAI